MNRSTEDHGPQFGRPVKPRASLSEAQKRLWILDKLMGPNAVYNTPRIYRLNGEVNLEALQNSLDTILQRHEVLRTCFRDDSGVPTTEVHATYPVEIRQIDLSAVPDAELNSKVRELESLEIGRPFDLEHGPLFRVTLIRLSEGEHHLIVCKHHIVTDEWSFQLFDSELAELYSAFCQKRPARLPQLTRSYSDYTESREKWMVSQEAQAQLDYWKEHLNGLPVLDFPIDFPRPETLSFQGKVKYLHLSAQVAEQLKTLSRSHGTTPYMTLLAVFHVLLYRYTGQEDIVVGTPVAGRKDLEFENLIGFFVNTLLIRTDLSGNPGFDEFLERVTSVTLNALDNQDIAFDKLVEELQPDRQLNRNPLFQIMFLLQNHDGSNLQMDGLKVEQIMVEKSTSGFDFAFTTIFKPEGLSLRVNYSTELFEDDTIDRMLGHYHRLLEAIIANPSQSISTLPLLTEAEQKRMFVEWNNTAQTFPTDTCVHQLFAAQVKRGPDLVALIHEGKKMTFQELDEASNRLANRLIGEGVVPGDLVGICLEPSFDMVVSIMSVLKAGAAYLPLDPSYPADRLDLIVRNAQVKKIVTETANADSLGEAARLAFLLDREAAVLENQSMADPSVEVGAESLAYVLYTSGSTGVPKGVMVSHRALLNHVLWRIDFTQLGDQDRLLQKTPLSFDVSVWELFGPLLSGAGMVLPRAVAVKDPAYLVNLIADEKVSVMSMVPSQLRSLLEIDRFKECRSLRFVNCGGEVLPPDLVEKLFSLSSARFFNGYGPTETTVGVCYWECKRGDERSPIPIGKPVANTEVYLLDRNQQPVPVGVAGEICIAGNSLASGYLNSPELTRERFIDFAPYGLPERRIYRTGDLGRYLPDGNLEFLGRIDRQVKLRGLRLELSEIEALLRQCAGVQDAIALVREDTPGDQRLVAYVTGKNQTVLDPSTLMDQIRRQLPLGMVPGVIVPLKQFPRTVTGKLDEKALPEPEYPEVEEKGLPPETLTATEERLRRIWAEVLGRENFGKQDNLFFLGGHSIHAIRIIARIRDEFGFSLPLQALFQEPSISATAAHIDRQAASSQDSH